MEQGIQAEHISKIYEIRKRVGWLRSQKETKTAVQDLSFHILPGEVVGLLGLNGAGKTTTIKMLSTLLLPTTGQITIDGYDITKHYKFIRKRINMIAGGERMVYWRMTGRENLWYFAQLYDVERRGLNEHIDKLLERVGLTDAADTVVERYSKGMKQRLQIARGLINNPTYLFMDEPTIGLDAPIARDLRSMVRKMADEGKGVLLTSHYLQEVEELCGRIYVIEDGRLIAQGNAEDLKILTHQERIVRVHLTSLPSEVKEALESVAQDSGAHIEMTTDENHHIVTVRHLQDLSGRIATIVATHGGILTRLEVEEPSLEDAILALTARSQKAKEVSTYVSN